MIWLAKLECVCLHRSPHEKHSLPAAKKGEGEPWAHLMRVDLMQTCLMPVEYQVHGHVFSSNSSGSHAITDDIRLLQILHHHSIEHTVF